ncbi:alpha/beta hydrolase [Fructobacillus sp. M2-14]|uniref:Alpha/beta hydrolase n=1 Tax=Fructobacillus broussonetiae TaxID=2713173 RepID=A0ABS5QZ83_9LACO|nr:alpha/beta hydrolase [Fructobacillus broussonetiae]MBS9338496.1 alpha/beta hydrolase [Fructobacillus broussonetiae]
MAFFKTTDGVSINYEDRGGEGPVAVLLSGFSGIQAEWVYQIEALQEKGFRVVTMDWRSHGRSQRTSKNLRIGRLAADLRELVLKLDLQDMTLVGHSMGGAAIFAYLSLFGEDRVKKVVVIDESPKLLNDSEWSAGLLNMNWNTFLVMVNTFIHQKLTYSPVSESLKDNLQKEKMAYPFDFDLAVPLLKNHLLEDWRENIYDLKAPMLYVAGAKSPLFRDSYYQEFEGLFGENDQLTVIENVGHLPHIEKPEKFNEEFFKFIM